jgi:hypothetical protein
MIGNCQRETSTKTYNVTNNVRLWLVLSSMIVLFPVTRYHHHVDAFFIQYPPALDIDGTVASTWKKRGGIARIGCPVDNVGLGCISSLHVRTPSTRWIRTPPTDVKMYPSKDSTAFTKKGESDDGGIDHRFGSHTKWHFLPYHPPLRRCTVRGVG